MGVKDGMWTSPITNHCQADEAPPSSVPLQVLGRATGPDFDSHGSEFFGKNIEFRVKYRLHDNVATCKIASKSWQRRCPEGISSPLLAVESSLQSVKVLKKPHKGWIGGLDM